MPISKTAMMTRRRLFPDGRPCSGHPFVNEVFEHMRIKELDKFDNLAVLERDDVENLIGEVCSARRMPHGPG